MEAKIYSNFIDNDDLSVPVMKDKLTGISITSKTSQIPEDLMSNPERSPSKISQIPEDMMANPVGILQVLDMFLC